jgi:hypothetical protein
MISMVVLLHTSWGARDIVKFFVLATSGGIRRTRVAQLLPFLTVFRRGKEMSSWLEVLRNKVIHSEEW